MLHSRQVTGLAHKQQATLETLARYKRSSLLRKFVTSSVFTNFRSKLECLSLASLFSLVQCFLVRPKPTRLKDFQVFHCREGSLPYPKHQIRLKRLTRDNHSSLIPELIIYVHKKLTLAQCYKTFYGRNSRMFAISQSLCPRQTLLAIAQAESQPSEAPL